MIGSNSFSGAVFVRSLLEQGEQVLGISRSPENAKPLLPYAWVEEKQLNSFEFSKLDLNLHTKEIINQVGDYRPDYVVNFAAQSMVAESWLYPDQWYQTNVVANVRLHEGLRKMDFIRRYVHVTTPEVYGSCSGVVTESHPFNPSTPYAASRAACDLHLITFFKQYQFPVCFTRAANVYGPGQPFYRIIPRAVYFFKKGRKLQLHGGGRSVRSFIYMEDVADGTIRVAREGMSGDCYHFSTDCYLSIREVVEKIAQRVGVNFEDAVEIVGDRPGKDAAYLLDSSKARQKLGWKDHVSLDKGIDETVHWIERFEKEIDGLPLDYIHKP